MVSRIRELPLVGLAVLWAAVIVAAPFGVEAISHEARVATALTYLGAGYICHQRPERSFHLAGHQLPVCARCTGLYLAAPFGLAAVMLMRRRRPADDRAYRRWRMAIAAAAVPTVISVALEWIGGPGLSSNVSRALTALPLGATLAALVGAATAGHFGPSDTLALQPHAGIDAHEPHARDDR
jgi:uncharacterized membrane protein